MVEKIAANYARITFSDDSILMIEAETIFVPSAGTMAKIDLTEGYSDSHPEVEERHDVLCGCGWGRLACPESEIPQFCPMCGFDFTSLEGN